MEVKEVVIIGAGMAGCAMALALARRQIPVTLVTSSIDQRTYHSSFVKSELYQLPFPSPLHTCSRAAEQLATMAQKSLDELICNDERDSSIDLHKRIQELLKNNPLVEWKSHHTAVDLITLEKHSMRSTDRYKRPMCLGAYVYNHDMHMMETILAKETILATGGAASLYLHSTHAASLQGCGLAMAAKAGARLLNMEHVQFHPLTLFERAGPCYPLPIALLKEGGKLLNAQKAPLEAALLESEIAAQSYQELASSQAEHLWLDLTALDTLALKEKFPQVDVLCLSRGYNFAKDLLPVVPAAHYTCGGIAVDRAGQTSLHRLRAIGEVACTGLFYDFREEEMSLLESLTWAVATADDIAKQTGKFAYYFPDVREWEKPIAQRSPSFIGEDNALLKRVMWNYVGLDRTKPRLQRGKAWLEELQRQNQKLTDELFSLEGLRLLNAIQAAQIIAHAAL